MISGLYTLLVWELVLGGGGRIFPVGPITLRILIFFMTLVVWFIASAQGKHRSGQALALAMVYAFVIAHLPAMLTDATSLQLDRQPFAQIQGLLFVFSAPFIAMAINSVQVVEKTANILMLSGFVSASALIILTVLILLGAVDLGAIYQWSWTTEEISFRSGNQVFSKGLFLIGVALAFFVVLRPRFWLVISFALAFCIVASLTRGLVASAALAIIYALIANRRYGVMYFVIVAIFFGSIAYVDEIISFLVGTEDRASSLQTRLDDFQAFFSQASLQMFVMGEGFGSSLNGRHAIENSYVWALWRFGLLGLLFWMSPFFVAYHFYRKISVWSKYRKLATAYFAGMIMLALATATNPFINNSIGILYSLIAIFSLRQMALHTHSDAGHLDQNSNS